MTSTDEPKIKIAVLNLFINLTWKDSERDPDSQTRKQMIDMNLKDMLTKMRDKERDHEVKTYYDRIINKLN